MRANEITVEIRNKDLVRVGMVPTDELNLEVAGKHNGLGEWTLVLPADHPLTKLLIEPGAGIIVTGPTDVLMSGPMVSFTRSQSASNPTGILTVSGVDDAVILADYQAWPDPDRLPAQQLVDYDVRTGNAESVMYGYVNANCGPAALAARHKARLVMGPNLGRGPLVTRSARFEKLGEILSSIGNVSGLGFRVVQRENNLVFEVFQPQDRTDLIRLDVLNGTLQSQDVTVTAPDATQVVVGTKNVEQRSFTTGTTAASQAAENQWGRRIETWVDRKTSPNENIENATNDAIIQALATNGLTKVATKLVPMDDATMIFQVNWNIGDTVAVVSGDTELTSWVSGFVLVVTSDGTRIGVTLGDPAELDPQAAMQALIRSLGMRIAALERATTPAPA